jgi:acetyl-CoA/propionyl-CoA carboxylase biotin carboxyl carrier protein
MLQPNYEIPGSYDSLVAKLISWGQTREAALGRLKQALREYRIEGVTTLLPFYQWIIEQPDFVAGHYDTGFLAAHFKPEMLPASETSPAAESAEKPAPQRLEMEVNGKRFEVAVYGLKQTPEAQSSPRRPGAKAKRSGPEQASGNPQQIIAPMAGTLVKLNAEAGQTLEQGQVVCVIESMKMENDIVSHRTGVVKAISVSTGEKVQAGALLLEFAD